MLNTILCESSSILFIFTTALLSYLKFSVHNIISDDREYNIYSLYIHRSYLTGAALPLSLLNLGWERFSRFCSSKISGVPSVVHWSAAPAKLYIYVYAYMCVYIFSRFLFLILHSDEIYIHIYTRIFQFSKTTVTFPELLIAVTIILSRHKSLLNTNQPDSYHKKKHEDSCFGRWF